MRYKPMPQELHYTIYHWHMIDLFIAATNAGLARLIFLHQPADQRFLDQMEKHYDAHFIRDDARFAPLHSKLDEYFSGKRVVFDEEVEFLEGTDFQRQVWQRLRRIPFGQTVTYGQLATEFGKPQASRAVGAANGANPIAIIIPCHRVVEANGKLGGYGGGLEVKDALLRLEGAII